MDSNNLLSRDVLKKLKEIKKCSEDLNTIFSRRKNRVQFTPTEWQRIAIEARSLNEIIQAIFSNAEVNGAQKISTEPRDPIRIKNGQKNLKLIVLQFLEKRGEVHGVPLLELTNEFLVYFENMKSGSVEMKLKETDVESIDYFVLDKSMRRNQSGRSIKTPGSQLKNAARAIIRNTQHYKKGSAPLFDPSVEY